MGDEKDRRSEGLPQLDQFVLQIEAQLDVELSVGLVHHEQVRLDGEGAGHGDALYHAGGNLIRVEFGGVREPDEGKDGVELAFDELLVPPLDFHAVGDVFAHGAPREAGRLLEHEGNVVLLRIGGFAVDVDVAFGRGHQLGEAVEERRLPAACGTDDGKEFALADGEVHVVEDEQIAEAFGQVLYFNLDRPGVLCGHGGSPSGWRSFRLRDQSSRSRTQR